MFQKTSNNVEQSLKLGRTSFEEAILELIEEVRQAQKFLQVNGTKTLQSVSLYIYISINVSICTINIYQ